MRERSTITRTAGVILAVGSAAAFVWMGLKAWNAVGVGPSGRLGAWLILPFLAGLALVDRGRHR